MARYVVPARMIREETIVVNSRFIATLAPVLSVDEARAFISQIRSEFAEASHNVPAYLVGYGSSVIEHCSDDGEPAGTAGRPALAVLKGSGLGDAGVVITRYFGGTKLGTGGLVRAYSEAVELVVEAVPRAERIPTCTVMVSLPYRWLERLRRLVEAHGGRVLEEEFAGDITLSASFPLDRYDGFSASLKQGSNDTLQALVVSTQEELVPIKQ